MRFAILALYLAAGLPTAAKAAELVMFRQDLCEWCAMWEEEIGGFYAKTDEGKRAPLRRVDIHQQRPADLAALKPVIYTPTFVVMHDGAERGRILGYPGADFFWSLLNQILEKLPEDAPASVAKNQARTSSGF